MSGLLTLKPKAEAEVQAEAEAQEQAQAQACTGIQTGAIESVSKR